MTAATECGYEILLHLPYSPDMAPSDFYLFSNLKPYLRGTQYRSNGGVIEAVNEYLGDQENAFYFEGLRKFEQRWAKCIALKRDYIEKLWSNLHSLVARSTRGFLIIPRMRLIPMRTIPASDNSEINCKCLFPCLSNI